MLNKLVFFSLVFISTEMVGMDANDPHAMKLNNGAKMSLSAFFEVCKNLNQLRVEKYDHFVALVEKARNDKHEIKNPDIIASLLKEKMLLSDGKIDQETRNVIISGVKNAP